MSIPEEKIASLVKKRAGLKSYITLCMKNLNALDVDDLKIHFRARKSTILNYLQKVQKVDESSASTGEKNTSLDALPDFLRFP